MTATGRRWVLPSCNALAVVLCIYRSVLGVCVSRYGTTHCWCSYVSRYTDLCELVLGVSMYFS